MTFKSILLRPLDIMGARARVFSVFSAMLACSR